MDVRSYCECIYIHTKLLQALYFIFIDSLHDDIASEYVETDPDYDGIGTRNTKKGTELYYNIENIIERFIMTYCWISNMC